MSRPHVLIVGGSGVFGYGLWQGQGWPERESRGRPASDTELVRTWTMRSRGDRLKPEAGGETRENASDARRSGAEEEFGLQPFSWAGRKFTSKVTVGNLK